VVYYDGGEFNSAERRTVMTNTEMLQKAIQDSGMKINAILNKTGIKSYSTLREKVANKREFTASEIMMLCEILNLDGDQREAIFFANNGELHSA
jgi:hypothetical protein